MNCRIPRCQNITMRPVPFPLPTYASRFTNHKQDAYKVRQQGPSNSFYLFFRGVAKAALYCAHRTSTFLSCAFCEQEGHLATLPLSAGGHFQQPT